MKLLSCCSYNIGDFLDKFVGEIPVAIFDGVADGWEGDLFGSRPTTRAEDGVLKLVAVGELRRRLLVITIALGGVCIE